MPTKVRDKAHVEIEATMRVILNIQLKTDVNGIKNMLSLSSVVEDVLDDRSLLIHMPIHQGYHYPLPRDSTFAMLFFIDSKMYSLPVQFEERIEQDGFVYAKIRRLGEITPTQCRDSYRLPCSMPITVERLWMNEREIYPERQPADGQMIDISDGGILFATDENIEKHEKITLAFDMGNPVTIEGIALRTDRIENGKYLFRVAAQFKNNDEVQKSRFCKFITEKQLEERRRWMQN